MDLVGHGPKFVIYRLNCSNTEMTNVQEIMDTEPSPFDFGVFVLLCYVIVIVPNL